jgi:decaprenyl-phosphate phosphoribosyltransferase
MAHSTVPVITNAADPPRPVALSLLVSLRPAQWTKNLIVFTALLFGQRGAQPAFLDPQAVGRSLAAFVIFCALSGVVYLINDVADRDADRLHPTKRYRPIASGAVLPGLAIGTATVLTAAALASA